MLIIKLPSQVLVIAAVVACLVTLGCSEAAAPPPASTLAPLPTYTPYPTHTPYPTLVEAATDTPYPTATARPTHTPYPTLAALPTYTPFPTATAYPTLAPYPTHTPYPTPTPQPTATPLPSVTPTSIPTPTATSMPTVTPTPEPETWVYGKETDELTGKVFHLLTSSGESVPPGSLRSLSLICVDADFFLASAFWGDEYIAENVRTDVIKTQYKVDDGQLKSTGSTETSSNHSSFFSDSEQFLADILNGSEVIVRVESYDGDTSTAKFPLKGLPEAIKQLPCI